MKMKANVMMTALCALALNTVGAADFKPADVLVYTRWQYVKNPQTGQVVKKGAFHHTSTEAGAEEIRRYFTANRFSCLVTDNPAVFVSPAMKKIRCVVFACTNHEQFETDAQREAFYDFVKRGGGVLALHSASANERGQKRWRDFLGGSFERHYSIMQSVPFTHIDRTHPAMACLPAGYVWEKDEIYLNHPDDSVRPLLVLAWDDVNAKSRKGDKYGCPAIGGHVLEWCKTYGKGRIYYSALGHRPEDFGKMEFQLHLLTAAKWTMGLLPDRVEQDPSAHVEKTIDGARLVSGGRVVWQLNVSTREGKQFVHPMRLPDGRVFTDARCADHPWHLGLWFCWKYINGVNYWEPAGRNPADNLLPAGLTVTKSAEILPHGAGCTFKSSLWYGPRAEPGHVILDEEREWEFTPPDAKGCYRVIAKHVFTARERVTFDCRRPVGYGGFSLRMDAMMHGCYMRCDGKDINPKRNVAVPAGTKELAYVGPSSGHGVSVKMLSPLPSERIYAWADRRFANPVPMYDKPVTLEKGEKMTLAYEVSVY